MTVAAGVEAQAREHNKHVFARGKTRGWFSADRHHSLVMPVAALLFTVPTILEQLAAEEELSIPTDGPKTTSFALHDSAPTVALLIPQTQLVEMTPLRKTHGRLSIKLPAEIQAVVPADARRESRKCLPKLLLKHLKHGRPGAAAAAAAAAE